jgi:hypothetical protein
VVGRIQLIATRRVTLRVQMFASLVRSIAVRRRAVRIEAMAAASTEALARAVLDTTAMDDAG